MHSTHAPFFAWPGSWPRPDDEELSLEDRYRLCDGQLAAAIRKHMEDVWRTTGGRIRYISDGDPGKWWTWLWGPIDIWRRSKGLKPRTEAYADFVCRPRSGKSLKAYEFADFGEYVRRYRIAYDVFLQFRADHRCPELKLLIGVPFFYDVMLFADNYVGGDAILAAITDQFSEIAGFVADEDALYSIEMPAEQVLVALASRLGLGGIAARGCARMFSTFVSRLPAGLPLALHPCWGRLGGRTAIEGVMDHYLHFLPQSYRRWMCHAIQSPKRSAELVDELLKAAPGRIQLVMWPFAAGAATALTEAKSYTSLRRITPEVRGSTLFSGGVCHESLTKVEVDERKHAVVNGSGHAFDAWGPSCGLSGCAPDEAKRVVEQAVGWS